MKKIMFVFLVFISICVYAEPPKEWLDKYNAFMSKYDIKNAIEYGLKGGNLELLWQKARSDAQTLFLGLPKNYSDFGSDYYGYYNLVQIRENELMILAYQHKDRESLLKAKELYE